MARNLRERLKKIVLILRLQKEGLRNDSELDRKVSKIWLRIVPRRNLTQVLLNNSSLGQLINLLCSII